MQNVEGKGGKTLGTVLLDLLFLCTILPQQITQSIIQFQINRNPSAPWHNSIKYWQLRVCFLPPTDLGYAHRTHSCNLQYIYILKKANTKNETFRNWQELAEVTRFCKWHFSFCKLHYLTWFISRFYKKKPLLPTTAFLLCSSV